MVILCSSNSCNLISKLCFLPYSGWIAMGNISLHRAPGRYDRHGPNIDLPQQDSTNAYRFFPYPNWRTSLIVSF